MKRLAILLPATLAALLLAAGPLHAGPFNRDKGGNDRVWVARKGGDQAESGRKGGKQADAPAKGGEMSARQAGELARNRYGGQVLDVRPAGGGSYRVKLLNRGEVRTVTIGGNGK